jgi:hypothetical protein
MDLKYNAVTMYICPATRYLQEYEIKSNNDNFCFVYDPY